MNRAKKICEKVDESIKPEVITLAEAVLAMQDKIVQQIPIYEEADLDQEVRVGTGEIVHRSNPVVQEFRATVRDYAAALNNLQNIVKDNSVTESIASLEDFRKKIKAAK